MKKKEDLAWAGLATFLFFYSFGVAQGSGLISLYMSWLDYPDQIMVVSLIEIGLKLKKNLK